MSRRVGSPKAVVTAAPAEENSESVRVGVAVPSPCPSGGDEAGEPAELGELGAPRAPRGPAGGRLGDQPRPGGGGPAGRRRARPGPSPGSGGGQGQSLQPPRRPDQGGGRLLGQGRGGQVVGDGKPGRLPGPAGPIRGR